MQLPFCDIGKTAFPKNKLGKAVFYG